MKIKCYIQLWLPVLAYCVLLVLYQHSLCITWLLLEKAGITYWWSLKQIWVAWSTFWKSIKFIHTLLFAWMVCREETANNRLLREHKFVS